MRKLLIKPVAVACIAWLGLAGCESKTTERETYNAWCKLYKRQDITLQEWRLLRKNYMLPGGEAARAADAANSAAAMSAAAMGISAANAGRR